MCMKDLMIKNCDIKLLGKLHFFLQNNVKACSWRYAEDFVTPEEFKYFLCIELLNKENKRDRPEIR